MNGYGRCLACGRTQNTHAPGCPADPGEWMEGRLRDEAELGDTAARRRDDAATQRHDAVNHPAHYTAHPSGVECIAITEHMGFCLGNAVKYIWRADLKHDDALEDLKKARWYLDREIARREGSNSVG
jgi:hypothetical protein